MDWPVSRCGCGIERSGALLFFEPIGVELFENGLECDFGLPSGHRSQSRRIPDQPVRGSESFGIAFDSRTNATQRNQLIKNFLDR